MTGLPDVAEVAVIGLPSAEWGESPYAVVVPRPAAHLSEADLITWTRDRLAHFKCPVGVSFVTSLARTASGKLQKQAIKASLSSPGGFLVKAQVTPVQVAFQPLPRAVRADARPAEPVCYRRSAQRLGAGRPGALAQLVERLHGMQEVRGSNPQSSTR